MTKDYFLAAMRKSRPPYESGDTNFSDINCIPEEIADAEVYDAWHTHVVDYCGAGADIALEQIPVKFVTDDLRRKAIYRSVRSLIYISPEHTDSYRELVLYGLKQSKMTFMMMHNSLRTLDFIKEVVDIVPGVFDFKWNAQGWIESVMTKELRDKVLLTNVRLALSLPEDQVTWGQWKHLFTTQEGAIEILDQNDRLDLYVRYLQEGNWPEHESGNSPAKPDSLNGLADILTKIEANSDHYPPDAFSLIYKAKLLSLPIEDVIPVMKSADRIKVLMNLYPEDVLRKHMKLNRSLRGALLENDLGM